MTGATSEAARPKLVANVRSNRSSSGVAVRCVSCGSRPRMRRESWRMTPMPGSIVLIPKHLSVVRRDEARRVDGMRSSSRDEIVNGRFVAFTRVINQAEMNADRTLTMEVEGRADRLVRVHVHPRHEPSRLIRVNRQQTDSRGAVLLVDPAEVRSVRAVTSEINSALRRIDQEGPPQCVVRVPDPSPRCVDGFEKIHLRVLDGDGFVPVQFCAR